jgi:N-acetylmuramoyl-L-alanine amidase
MRQIREIVVHCTDSPDDLDIGLAEVNEWHRQRGWLSPSGISCGYHFIIRRDGRIEVGRPLSEIGAHAKGHNRASIGICWVGRREITPKQKSALKALVVRLKGLFSVDLEKVLGHYEVDGGKTCPNLDMVKFRAELIFKD